MQRCCDSTAPSTVGTHKHRRPPPPPQHFVNKDLAQAVYQPIITCEGCSHEDSQFVYEDSCSLSFVIHPRDSFWGGLLTAVLVYRGYANLPPPLIPQFCR